MFAGLHLGNTFETWVSLFFRVWACVNECMYYKPEQVLKHCWTQINQIAFPNRILMFGQILKRDLVQEFFLTPPCISCVILSIEHTDSKTRQKYWSRHKGLHHLSLSVSMWKYILHTYTTQKFYINISTKERLLNWILMKRSNLIFFPQFSIWDFFFWNDFDRAIVCLKNINLNRNYQKN